MPNFGVSRGQNAGQDAALRWVTNSLKVWNCSNIWEQT